MKNESPSFRIRPLGEEDLGSLRALHRALVDEDIGYRRAPGEYGDDDPRSVSEWNLQTLENPANVFLVAVREVEGDESVIGYIRFLQSTSRRRTRHHGSFGIGVHESCRSQGVGQALLDALLEELRRIGIERVTLQVFSDNERAVRFYERNGFVASGILPGEIKMEDGRYRDLLLMHRWIQ